MDYEGQKTYVNQTNPFMTHSGVAITVVRADFAAAELTMSPDHFNPGGTLHGGALYTLADAAATTAARTDGHRYTTIDGTIRYHRAITAGTVRAEAVIRHRGRTLCSISVEMTDESGRLLADASFSAFKLEAIDLPAFQS